MAAWELIKTRPFSEVSVRDIAKVADVNHGFVHTWFGSKYGLLNEVARAIAEELSVDATKAPPEVEALDPSDERIVLLVRLVVWLNLEGHDFGSGLDLRIIDALAARYRTIVGLTEDDAQSAAYIAAALGIAIGGIGPVLQSGNVRLDEIFALWRHILGLLAEHPRQ